MPNFSVPFSNLSKTALTVNDNTVNTATSLKLVGRYVTNYSQPIAENFLKLLENSANATSPVNPIEGQLWYNTSAATFKGLKVYDGSSWVPTNNVHKVEGGISTAPYVPPFALPGDILVNTLTNQLWIYNGSSTILVGPSTATTELRNGVYVEPIKDINDAFHSAVLTYVDGDVISIYCKERFTPNPVVAGFTELRPGLNVVVRSFSGEDSFIEGNSKVALSLKISNVNTPIPADNFLRNDEAGTINGYLNINSDAGVRIGNPAQTVILEKVGSHVVLSNRISEGDIGLSVIKNNVLTQVVTVDGANLRVGINDLSPNATLHVNGTGIFSDKVTFGTALTTGTIIEPFVSNSVDIGSVGKAFRTVYAENFSFTSTTTNFSHVATGGIILHATTTPPIGWLACDGATLDAVANPEYLKLYAVLGPGSGTINSFTIPNLPGPGGNITYIIKY